MAEKDIGSLVVMEHSDVVGMLTFREVIQALVKNAEVAGGKGDNKYLQSFSRKAAVVLARHFQGRVTTWERRCRLESTRTASSRRRRRRSGCSESCESTW